MIARAVLSLFILLSMTSSTASAVCLLQVLQPDDLLGAKVRGQSDRRLAKAPTPYQRADRPIDVLHYDLRLNVSLDDIDLSGTVVATLTPTAAIDTVIFDFLSGTDTGGRGMTVSLVEVDGSVATASHAEDLVRIPLLATATPSDTLIVRIDFAGRPLRDWILGYGLRHFIDRTDEQFPILPNEPVLQTLSEPDAARSWWPCHDHPFDAATVDLTVVGPTRFTLAAPGLLVDDTDLGGGMRSQSWSMTTAIPSYLVSLNMADYVSWEDSVTVEHLVDAATGAVETRTMPLQFFVPSFEEAAARYTWAKTGKMIQTFASVFGPYPYADIKYGMSLFMFGGAMEHPTMSSMGQFSVSLADDPQIPAPAREWISAHELCHQWFGDAVRIERWGEIWLNEGIARWSEALWMELEYGDEAGRIWLDAIYRDSYPGTVVDPGELFGTTSYNKGARIVHQLRQVVGDDDFFRGLRQYMTDPALRFGPVNSGDFQAHFEAVYGESLDWYFGPWLNWAGRPSLTVVQYNDATGVHLSISQPADRVYRLPLPVRLHFEDGSSEDRTLWIGESGAQDEIDVMTTQRVTSIELDAERDWLLDVDVQASFLVERAKLLTPYPNPFNPQLTIPYFVAERTRVTVDIYDARGREVTSLNPGVVDAGIGSLVWDGMDSDGAAVASGVYHLRFVAENGVQERRSITMIR